MGPGPGPRAPSPRPGARVASFGPGPRPRAPDPSTGPGHGAPGPGRRGPGGPEAGPSLAPRGQRPGARGPLGCSEILSFGGEGARGGSMAGWLTSIRSPDPISAGGGGRGDPRGLGPRVPRPGPIRPRTRGRRGPRHNAPSVRSWVYGSRLGHCSGAPGPGGAASRRRAAFFPGHRQRSY